MKRSYEMNTWYGVVLGILLIAPATGGCRQTAQPAFNSKIMFDAKTVGELLHTPFTEEELAAFGKPPAPIDGYLTYFDPGLSVMQLRRDVLGDKKRHGYTDEEYAWEEGMPGYRQLHVSAMAQQLGVGWNDVVVPEGDEVPGIRTVATAQTICYLAKNPLLPSGMFRCAEAGDGWHAIISGTTKDDFGIGGNPDDSTSSIIGTAFIKKSH